MVVKHHRRDVLLGSASIAAYAAFSGKALAGTDSAKDFSNQYGMENFRGKPDLDFLLKAQQNAPKVPITKEAFEAYLDNSPLLRRMRDGETPEMYFLLLWHNASLDLTSQDHTTIKGVTDSTFGEQFGPHRSSRALAMVHLAMFEAINAIYRTRPSYHGIQGKIFTDVAGANASTPSTASVRLAISLAAYDTLAVLYKNKIPLINEVLNRTIPLIDDSVAARALGTQIGQAAAKEVLADRKYDPATGAFGDGSHDVAGAVSLTIEPKYADLQALGKLPANPGPLDWRPDSITGNLTALGGHWDECQTFGLKADLFIPPAPPAAGDSLFQANYADVRAIGGAPNAVNVAPRHPTGTTRTGNSPNNPLNAQNETFKGQFWGYDATALLCAPPRLYNQVATTIALNDRPIRQVSEMAFYLAIINMAMADAGMAAWTAKYKYHYARPVTYIRAVDPTGVILGTANQDWTPLGAPGTNGTGAGDNATPPFPAYPSGHATFGGALFQTMRRYFNTAKTGEPDFEFVSDEYNGVNRAPNGQVRPFTVRKFKSLTEAELENARSRILVGVHWQFDGDAGVAQGQKIGDYVFDHAFG